MKNGPAVEHQNGSGSGPLPIPSELPPAHPENANSRTIFASRGLWLALALTAAILVVYAPALQYGFVSFDDHRYVSENARVLGGLTWESVQWASTTGYFSNWHPLTWMSYMLDAELYGRNAGGYHLTNVILHIANTLLLFGLLNRMTGKMGRSAFVAGLFAVHPLHIESVAWVSERKDVLSTLFGMLAVWAYARYAERAQPGRYLVVVVFFGMSLMAKAMLVTLPVVLLLLDVWPLNRIALPADSASGPGWAWLRNQRAQAMRLVGEKLPLLVLTIAASVVTLLVQQPGGFAAFPLDFRLANAMVSYVSYIAMMLWPAGLSVFYPYQDTLPGWMAFGSMFVLIVVSVVVAREARGRPYLAVGWLWYLGTLTPVIGLVQVGSQAMADRYTYVPLIGLFLMAGWGVPDLLARSPYRRIALPAAAGIVICACVVTARVQVQRWESDASLWRRALIVTTGNYMAHHYMGTILASEGKLDEAQSHFVEAIRLKPDYADTYTNLGLVLMIQGRKDEALHFLSEAVRLNPEHAEAHNNLGVHLKNMGRFDEAVVHFGEALRLQPDYANAHYNLGNVLAVQGKTAEAAAHYTRALEISPENETIRGALKKLKGRP